jgi:copper transporter 1
MSLLADICSEMSGMSGCASYNTLCADDSVVEECTTDAAIPSMITTAQARDSSIALCDIMYMDGCDDCTADSCPHPLDTVSDLCLGMYMSNCSTWLTMCSAQTYDGLDYFCTNGGGDRPLAPNMIMYFHTGINDYLLFQDLVPQTDAEYYLACFVLCLLGIVLTYLKVHRQQTEARWASEEKHSNNNNNGGIDSSVLLDENNEASVNLDYADNNNNNNSKKKFPFIRNLQRMCLSLITIILDYGIMLVVMTYNAGFVTACILGLGLGQLCFGHLFLTHEVSEGCCD